MTRTRESSSAIGRANQQAGQKFEDWTEDHHERAANLGILVQIEHTQAVAKVVGGRLIYTEKGVADYVGTIWGGRSLAVEAKSLMRSRLGQRAITDKQRRHLDAVALAGGLALLLVEFRLQAGTARYAIPWKSVPWKMALSAYSLKKEDIAEWKAEGDCYLAKFCPDRGPPTSLKAKRTFARE